MDSIVRILVECPGSDGLAARNGAGVILMRNEVRGRLRTLDVEKASNLSSLIVDEIVSRIADGTLKPGDKLPAIEVLCQQLGVGRTSVREALKALEVIGLIAIRHGKGTCVGGGLARFFLKPFAWQNVLDREAMTALAETRRCCEGELAAMAAERATRDEIAEIEEAVERQMALLESPEFADGALDFHVTVWRAAHNEVMLHILDGIRGLLWQSISEAVALPDVRVPTVSQHRAISQAIADRRPDLARKAMVEHLRYVETAMLGFGTQ